MKKKRRPEQELHIAVVDHLRERAMPGVLWWHTNNNIALRGRRGAFIGKLMKSMGVRPGVGDILVFYKGKLFSLELKAAGGKPTPEQWAWMDAVKENGGYAHHCRGLDAALGILEMWGLIRGKTA